MEVILLEKIKNLGNLGDKVAVKNGYGRNYLIPQNKAAFATAENIAEFEKRRAELEKNEQVALSKAEERAAKFNDITLEIAAQASDEGKLYGSIGVAEVSEALKVREFNVKKRELILPLGPIHSTGEYKVIVQLHSDVSAELKLVVVQAK